LLFITDVVPYPVDRGQRVRVTNLLAGCAREHEVTFVGPRPEDEAGRANLETLCARVVWVDGVRAPGGSGEASLWWRAARAAPGIRNPRTVRMYLPFVSALAGLDLHAFDVIWAERPHIARLCHSVRRRTVLDLDDLEHVRIAAGMAIDRAWPPTARFAGQLYRYGLYRWMELSWSRGFRASVVCSEEDRDYLRSRGLQNAVVVANATGVVAGARWRPRRGAAGPLRIAFLGNMLHQPNVDAVAFFAEQILPVLHMTYPEATFEVIGPGATPQLAERFGPSVIFRGFVDDLAAALADYDVFAAPLRIGSGTKVKIVDAMACGMPIVTTSIGARGLHLDPGKHALIADTPADFAAAIVALRRDGERSLTMGRAAARVAEDRFMPEAIRASVAELLRGLAPGLETPAHSKSGRGMPKSGRSRSPSTQR